MGYLVLENWLDNIYNNNNCLVSHDTKYITLFLVMAPIITVPCHTPNVTTLSSDLMLQWVHTHPLCLPDGCLWSVVELTGISSKCHLSWSIIQPAIELLPTTLCFLISDRDSIKPNIWIETCNQRVKSDDKESVFNRKTQDGLQH